MRIKFIIAAFCFLSFSCNNKKEESNINSKEPVKADTAATIKTDITVNSFVPVDISPMDMSYFPDDYPISKMSGKVTRPPIARVVYSRPYLQGRKLFHDLLKYGEPWRLGANESTELDLFSDVTIQGKKIKAGRYILYSIPGPEKWIIVLNSNIDSWGLHPDASKDIERFTVPAVQTKNSIEYFTMLFQKTTSGADLFMAWDNVEVKLPITF